MAKRWYRIKVEAFYNFVPGGYKWGGRVSVFKLTWPWPPGWPIWEPAVADDIHLSTFVVEEIDSGYPWTNFKSCAASATCELSNVSPPSPLPSLGWLATAATVRIGRVVLQGTDQIGGGAVALSRAAGRSAITRSH